MPEPIEGHPEWEKNHIDVALEKGCVILGYTVQLKVLFANGNTGYSTRQTGDLNDVEALGMLQTHVLTMQRDILGTAEDPRLE